MKKIILFILFFAIAKITIAQTINELQDVCWPTGVSTNILNISGVPISQQCSTSVDRIKWVISGPAVFIPSATSDGKTCYSTTTGCGLGSAYCSKDFTPNGNGSITVTCYWGCFWQYSISKTIVSYPYNKTFQGSSYVTGPSSCDAGGIYNFTSINSWGNSGTWALLTGAPFTYFSSNPTSISIKRNDYVDVFQQVIPVEQSVHLVTTACYSICKNRPYQVNLNLNVIPSSEVLCSTGTVTLNASTLTSMVGPSVIPVGYTGYQYLYQWHKNGSAISGATNRTYNASTNGLYKVVCTRKYYSSGTLISTSQVSKVSNEYNLINLTSTASITSLKLNDKDNSIMVCSNNAVKINTCVASNMILTATTSGAFNKYRYTLWNASSTGSPLTQVNWGSAYNDWTIATAVPSSINAATAFAGWINTHSGNFVIRLELNNLPCYANPTRDLWIQVTGSTSPTASFKFVEIGGAVDAVLANTYTCSAPNTDIGGVSVGINGSASFGAIEWYKIGIRPVSSCTPGLWNINPSLVTPNSICALSDLTSLNLNAYFYQKTGTPNFFNNPTNIDKVFEVQLIVGSSTCGTNTMSGYFKVTPTHQYIRLMDADQGIKIYPNPVVDVLTIETDQISQYAIYDLHGKCIQEGSIDSGLNTVQTEKLINGSYILKVISDTNIYTQKFVVSH